MRSKEEIGNYLDEAFDKVWLMRSSPIFPRTDILIGSADIGTVFLEHFDGFLEKKGIF